MKELLSTLNRLNHVYEQIDLLNFRAHKDLPLTFNKADSKQLLPKNKRLQFSYSYLNKEKTRLTNLLLNQVIDLRVPEFSLNKTIHPQLIDKALKLKNIDENHSKQKLKRPSRDRKINKLKQLIDKIEDENLNLCHGYLNQIYVILLIHHLLPIELRKEPYQAGELLHDNDFRTKLLQFDYDRYLYEEFKPENYLRFLIYTRVHRMPDYVKSYDAREIIPEAAECGFSGIAFEISIDGLKECYVTFKGTEVNVDYTVSSRSKRFEKAVLETYKDWDYNVNAILVGSDKNLSQLNVARDFMRYIEDNIASQTLIYGLGHSLGGHFVQTLQLMDYCFDAGYTLNSAPVNLKLIQHVKPTLFSDDVWKKLFALTDDNDNVKFITPELRRQINRLLPHDYSQIINEVFEQDMTQVFYELPFTIWIGQKWEYNLSNWKYPFKNHPRAYLNSGEVHAYQKFFEQLFAYLSSSNTSRQVLRNSVSFIRLRTRILRNNINDPQTAKYFFDYSNYLYQSGAFNDQPQKIGQEFIEQNNSVIKGSLREWPFLKSINTDMFKLATYFHVIDGAKHFLNRTPNKL
ncbi:hypothetical protein FD33_GL002392 [Companilactobacillus paralimentarius DSM 13238 = JCM 10415]|uniref:DUF6792 domain-containing protein n=2 Tax=Companilactobacillus paralimentarius TaxID=83526 RepID=A0A0R1PET8_9LACO|nr:DUF6792 domain-containing protein [Companilactobacillus paralimentarius]KAE9565473.1 hypothetical protein ATN96_03240 [Companilactobacillus paralimentarius]KRL31008.1 hypothetical protein FD33_GL002392 [Companilactobacillus paralimentarius DSM 13238 = JCM 10415]MDR4933548.1 hypothetical protein [Companilactobacillus paralimentarius]QFR70019.1 hypothetical protein LP238_09820 [Companilactobacillus paralimentarius]